jgi:hypothetical protein
MQAPIAVSPPVFFSPIPVVSLDLFVHECILNLEQDDPEETFAAIERFGMSVGTKLAHQVQQSVPNIAAASRLLAKNLWPLIFGHAAEISDRPPFILEDAEFLLLRRHYQFSSLYSEISVFAVCFARGVFTALKFPCGIRMDPEAPLGRLRLVLAEI